jgi:8-oxo-dGTP pyrophosphatase MutT (NUDIX family)
MVSIGHGNYVVVVQHIGGSKASDIQLVLHREPRFGKIWFLAGSILSNEEHVDAAVRELFEENGLTLAIDDLMHLSNNHARVPFLVSKHRLVYVFPASIPMPFVTANLRTKAKVSHQAVTTHSTINPDGFYVVPSKIDIVWITWTPCIHR